MTSGLTWNAGRCELISTAQAVYVRNVRDHAHRCCCGLRLSKHTCIHGLGEDTHDMVRERRGTIEKMLRGRQAQEHEDTNITLFAWVPGTRYAVCTYQVLPTALYARMI